VESANDLPVPVSPCLLWGRHAYWPCSATALARVADALLCAAWSAAFCVPKLRVRCGAHSTLAGPNLPQT